MMRNPSPESSTSLSESASWPEYLSDYEALVQHLRSQLENLTNVEKGRRFAKLVQRLTPQTDYGSGYDLPVMSPSLSNDEGVDMSAAAQHGSGLMYIQSKLWIDRAEDLDSIMSKFDAYLSKHHAEKGLGQSRLAFEPTDEKAPVSFLIVTASKLKGILKKYQEHPYSSRAFFDQLAKGQRIRTVDGPEILTILRVVYTKLFELPQELTITLGEKPLHRENVYLGTISSVQLKQLYKKFGEALFFENVRDFIDPTRTREQAGRTTPKLGDYSDR